MWKLALAIVGLAIVAALIMASRQPDSFRVVRSISVHAPPARAYALVSDFNEWKSWSPFEKMDPAMKRTISAPSSGVGATYEWAGNSKAGAGQMTITRTEPDSAIGVRLDFTKPIEGHNRVEFTFVPQGEETLVTWSMDGPRPFVSRFMGLFFDMDQIIGGQFSEGLAQLKTLAERPST